MSRTGNVAPESMWPSGTMWSWRVRGCTGLLGSGSGASAMRIYGLAVAALYCKIGGSGVTVPWRRPGRLLVSQVSASAI